MHSLHEEVRQEELVRSRFRRRLAVLKTTYNIQRSGTTADLIDSLHWRVDNRNLLQNAYALVCRDLDQRHSVKRFATSAEDRFAERFKAEWKIRLYRQVWVGNFALDFFTPAFGTYKSDCERGYGLKGLAFEIDGPIHETEPKIKKDQHKTESLNDLGILVWRLTNEQVFEGRALPNRTNFQKQFGKLCSRERARIWSRIYLLTILYHGNFGMVRSYFSRLKTVSEWELTA